jgi:hypothetical protein
MEQKSRGVFIKGRARVSGLASDKNAKIVDLMKLNKN